MTTTKSLAYLTIIALVLSIVYLFGAETQRVDASAPSGLPATVATTSIAAVSPTASTIFATSTCSARVVSTQGSAIMLTFSDYANHTPTATFGHLQLASTTVAYDSGQYGCGRVKAYSFAAQTLTVSDTN